MVFARTTAEVSDVLRIAFEHRVPVTPFGAGTSLDGHVIPVEGGISLDLSQMDRVVALRPTDLTITVAAGVPRSKVNDAAGRHGLMFPVDPGADASIGGMAATNASGTTTVRYGNMRRQVLALEAVLGDGTVVRTGGRAMKSSAGYDIGQLLVGSEGTLAVITELTLRLYPIPEDTVAMRSSFPDVHAAVGAVSDMVAIAPSLTRAELVDAYAVHAMNRFSGTAFAEEPSLFVELSGTTAAVSEDAETAIEVAQAHGCTAIEKVTDHTARVRMWRARHDLAFALADLHPGRSQVNTDVCVPVSELPGAIEAARATVDRLALDAAILGHVGDGNFHVSAMIDIADPEHREALEALEDEVVHYALACGGTCSGEHGIGLGKRAFLAEEHPDLMPIMAAVKSIFDPHGILNPGKVLDAEAAQRQR